MGCADEPEGAPEEHQDDASRESPLSRGSAPPRHEPCEHEVHRHVGALVHDPEARRPPGLDQLGEPSIVQVTLQICSGYDREPEAGNEQERRDEDDQAESFFRRPQ